MREGYFADVDTARRHLEKEHEGVNIEWSRSLRMPKDRRQIKCLKCGQLVLGQPVQVALEHLREKHGVDAAKPGANELLILSCRCCSMRLVSQAEFEAHFKCCYEGAAKL